MQNVNKLRRSFGSVWDEIYSFGIYSAVIIHPPVESWGLDQQSLRWPLNDPTAYLTSCGSDASDSDVHIFVKKKKKRDY